MLKTQTGSFSRSASAQKQRPQTSKTSLSKRTIDLYACKPLHKRIREAYQIHSVTDVRTQPHFQPLPHKPHPTLDSEQPEAVCGWLD
jgi:hypothetical protein